MPSVGSSSSSSFGPPQKQRERQQLLLAAAEASAAPVQQPHQPRKQIQHAVHGLARVGRRFGAPHQHVLAHRQVRKDLPSLRYIADAQPHRA